MSHKSQTNNYTDFFYKAFRNILFISIPLVIVSALILSLPHSSAEGSVSGDATRVDSVTLNLPVSCTISATELTPHVATFEGGGLHRENIGTTKVGVFCNDNNGYNIYAVGNSNNIDGNTDLVVSGLSSDYNIKTGIYSSGSTVSSWGMKITPGTGTGSESERTPPTANNGYNNYNVVPNTYTMVASRASGTNMNPNVDLDITGSYFTTTYDIYASSAQPAGTYTGKVKYVLTHPNTNAPSTINDIDAAFAMAGKQKAYQDSEGSYYAMQDMTSDICNSVLNTGESTTARLVDTRDHNIYYVTKLKDNHCWMTQNLDLDINGPNTSPLTSENTDISTTASGSGIYSTAYGYSENNGVWTWNPGTTTGNIIVDYDNNTADGWNRNNVAPTSAEGGDTYFYASNTTADDIKYTSLQACIDDDHAKADCRHYHVGNYYNWTVAIASNNSNGFNINYTNAANSICPKGWRLPIATNSDKSVYEFGELLFQQGITTSKTDDTYAANGFNNIRKSPTWLVRSGYFYASKSLNGALRSGTYWSTTTKDSSVAYYLFFNSGTGQPAVPEARFIGGSIRCLAR
ncbi:hypothetical protein IJJ53_04010 [Candidatus Saccharibacteria bacterium]|nr:hypothetical protein [Candidatus Saccharibacteria bacterium]